MNKTLAVILGGGRGTRLYPLTKYRSKPAVPLGGKYRLIDITISNCLHSGIEKVFILTQFNSVSLNKHINHTYKFDAFRDGFVDIIAAEQTIEVDSWYQGTADAVRKSMKNFKTYNIDDVLILSGDHLYFMDYKEMLEEHRKSNADLTIAVKPVSRDKAKEFGILKADNEKNIIKFVEKPKTDELLDELVIPELAEKSENSLIASMGIYIFKANILVELLERKYPDAVDFGKEIIPYSIGDKRVKAFFYDGYWEDIGTIKAFYNANMDFLGTRNEDLYDPHKRIYTHSRFLAGTTLKNTKVYNCIINDGSTIIDAELTNSIIGIRSIINSGTKIYNSLIMGNDFYESEKDLYYILTSDKIPPIGIGKNCEIHNAIIDKNARIGNNVKILPKTPNDDKDYNNYCIRDGIVVIEKGAIIPDGTII